MPSRASRCSRPFATGLDDLRFLVGRWTSNDGVVADSGGRSSGTSIVTEETGGRALLRRDHTELFDANGKTVGSFDQIMLIYAEGDALRAEYTDGEHVIHYVRACSMPGRSVTFETATEPGRPGFRLGYDLEDASTLRVTLETAPPGATEFRKVASGTLHRESRRATTTRSACPPCP